MIIAFFVLIFIDPGRAKDFGTLVASLQIDTESMTNYLTESGKFSNEFRGHF